MHPTVLVLLAEQRLAEFYAAADRQRLVRASRVSCSGGRRGRPERHTSRGSRFRLLRLRRLARLVRPVSPAVAG